MNCFRIGATIKYYMFRTQTIPQRSRNLRKCDERTIQAPSKALARLCMTTADAIYISNVFSNSLFQLLSSVFSAHVKHNLHKKASVGTKILYVFIFTSPL